jgi:hypothetical protein
MSVEYRVLRNDPETHVVTVRWQDGDNYRDEAYDLEMVLPGAKRTFEQMNLPFDYEAAFGYLEGRLEQLKDTVRVLPPMWPLNALYQQICETTPEEERPPIPEPMSA